MDEERSMEFSEVLAAAKCGDQDAVQLLHDRHMEAVALRAHGRLRPSLRRLVDTVDIAQSVFCEALRRLPELEDRGEDAFRHWLLIRTERKIVDRLRRMMGANGGLREGELDVHAREPVASGRGPVTAAAVADELARIDEALARLPDVDRDVIVLRGRQRLPHEEVARRLGLGSADAARMRYARALIALRSRCSPPPA